VPHLASKALLLNLAFAPTHADPHRALVVPLYMQPHWGIEMIIEHRDPLIGKQVNRFSAPFGEMPGWFEVRVVAKFSVISDLWSEK
jgi:hypothetical protein